MSVTSFRTVKVYIYIVSSPVQHCKRKGGLVNIVQHFVGSPEFRRYNLIG